MTDRHTIKAAATGGGGPDKTVVMRNDRPSWRPNPNNTGVSVRKKIF